MMLFSVGVGVVIDIFPWEVTYKVLLRVAPCGVCTLRGVE